MLLSTKATYVFILIVASHMLVDMSHSMSQPTFSYNKILLTLHTTEDLSLCFLVPIHSISPIILVTLPTFSYSLSSWLFFLVFV